MTFFANLKRLLSSHTATDRSLSYRLVCRLMASILFLQTPVLTAAPQNMSASTHGSLAQTLIQQVFVNFERQFQAAGHLQLKLEVLNLYVQFVNDLIVILTEQASGATPAVAIIPSSSLLTAAGRESNGGVAIGQVQQIIDLILSLPPGSGHSGGRVFTVDLESVAQQLAQLTEEQLAGIVETLRRQLETVRNQLTHDHSPVELGATVQMGSVEFVELLKNQARLQDRPAENPVAPPQPARGVFHNLLMKLGERVHQADQARQVRWSKWLEARAARRKAAEARRAEREERKQERIARERYERNFGESYSYSSSYTKRYHPVSIGTVFLALFASLLAIFIGSAGGFLIGAIAGFFVREIVLSHAQDWRIANSAFDGVVYTITGIGALGGFAFAYRFCTDVLLSYRDSHKNRY